MSPVDQQLAETILTHKETLIRDVCTRLEKLSRSHYEVIPYERHLEREEALLTALLKGLQQPEHGAFIDFIDHIGGLRSNEGYSLEEVQRALNIFEQELWSVLIRTQPVDGRLVAMLSLCNRLFGQARDHLAKIYLSRSQDIQTELNDLRVRFYGYFKKEKESET
ncbi:hypothetical protein JXO59_12585 [candidate division KSB1 bacterium]|nr:hypothetical protein [candidate division KSB1 bacterium]